MKIDRYELRERLGPSATGEVFVAFDSKLEREVAVTLLAAAAGDQAERRRFVCEARALASLHHPNVIEVFDFGAPPGSAPYVVAELVEGPDLATLAARNGPLPEPVLVAVGVELAAALAHAHARGIVHGAVAPASLLLSRGRLVLTDFGIVSVPAARDPGAPGRPPGCVAPERIGGRPPDPRTDVFGLGVVLYSLGTGHAPFPSEGPGDPLSPRGSPEPLQGRRPDVGGELALLVHRCLEPAPDRRPHHALGLRQALQRMLEDRGLRDARAVLAAYERDPSLGDLAWHPAPSSGEHQALSRAASGARRVRRVLLGLAVAGVVAAAAVLAGWTDRVPDAVVRLLQRGGR